MQSNMSNERRKQSVILMYLKCCPCYPCPALLGLSGTLQELTSKHFLCASVSQGF